MIFKPISDLVQLDQSKISDSMLLVRSGAENDAKDYKLTISNLMDSITSENGTTVIDNSYFQDGTQSLTFQNVYCPGYYHEDSSVSPGGYIVFSLSTPYILTQGSYVSISHIKFLQMSVFTTDGSGYIVDSSGDSDSFTDLNNYVTYISNYTKNNAIGLGNITLGISGKNQFNIIVATAQRIRTNQSTPETYLTKNTPCTVICTLQLQKNNSI